MRSHRFSIAGLMGVVLLAAIGLAALRTPSETWAGIVLLATLAALGIASVGAICLRGASRAGFLGFAVFGWIYMAAAFPPYGVWPKLPTQSLLEQLAPRIAGIKGPFPPAGGMRRYGGGGMRSIGASSGDSGSSTGGFRGQVTARGPGAAAAEHFFQIGHCLFALLAASLGAVLSRWLFGSGNRKVRGNHRPLAGSRTTCARGSGGSSRSSSCCRAWPWCRSPAPARSFPLGSGPARHFC